MLFSKTRKPNKPTFNFITIYIWLCLPAFFFACNSPQKKQAEAANYNKILSLASHTYDIGNPQKAMHYLDSAMANRTDIEPRQRFTYDVYHYNYYYFIQGDMDSSMLYADSMINIFDTPEKRLKYSSQLGEAYFYKGDILFSQNKYDDAYQNYYQGKLLASDRLDECTLSNYNYSLGMIMYKQEHFKQAGVYFKTGLGQIGKCDMTFRAFLRQQELFNNTGLCYSKIDKRDSALLYFNRGLKFIDSAGARFSGQKEDLAVCRGVIYGNEANIYIKNNNYLGAESLLNKSIAINLRPNHDNKDAQLSELKLAHLYLLQNKSDSLIKLLRAVRVQFDTIKNTTAEADWNGLMASYYSSKSQPQPAFNYFVKHDSLKDSINRRDKDLKETNLTDQMETLRKNHELNGLSKNNRLRQFYLKVAIFLGLMLLFIIFLVYRNWQKSKKNINILGGLNTQIKEQNDNLEQALTELRQGSQEKDRILRTVAHDLRNPLGGVAALTGLMAEESEYTEQQKELIVLIKETSNNSLELINEILEATYDVAAKSNKEHELVDINTLVSNSIELLRFKAAEKHQQIIFKPAETPIALFISREQIWRVVSNLISNAVKFSPNNGTIQVKVIDDGKQLRIAVADNGIGIPDNFKDKIFNMFTDAKRPGTAGEKSFGLGLSICRQIVENHHGKIWFESNNGDGTIFYVSLIKPAKGII